MRRPDITLWVPPASVRPGDVELEVDGIKHEVVQVSRPRSRIVPRVKRSNIRAGDQVLGVVGPGLVRLRRQLDSSIVWVPEDKVAAGDEVLDQRTDIEVRVKVRRPGEVVKAGGCAVFLTVSARHHRGTRLLELLEAMRGASEAMSSGRAAQDARRELGIVWQERIFECTHGDEFAFHPHFHYVLFLDRPWAGDTSAAAVCKAFGPLWALWQRSLAEDGFEALAEVNGESAGFDARLIDLSSSASIVEMARYAHKAHDTELTQAFTSPTVALLESVGADRGAAVRLLARQATFDARRVEREAGSAAREVVGGVFKVGKAPEVERGKRHRSIAQVMEDMAVCGELEDQAIVKEFKQVMSELRMPQRKPSPGMRAAFVELAAALAEAGVDVPGALREPEKTDEEIAAEQEEAATFGHIQRAAYSKWFAWEVAEMRAAARTGGLPALYEFLSARGRNTADPPADGWCVEPLGFELAEQFSEEVRQ